MIPASMPATREDEILRQISGFYPTPRRVVEMMIAELGPITSGERILEPSAGRGDIAEYLRSAGADVLAIEPHHRLASILRSRGFQVLETSFESYAGEATWTKIVMNPPFADGLDFAHIRRAFDLLGPGGALVSLLTDGDDDVTAPEKAEFARWLTETQAIRTMRLARLEPDLFGAPHAFRPSPVPKRLLSLVKRENAPDEARTA